MAGGKVASGCISAAGKAKMATLRKRRKKLKHGAATYWVVDFSVTENGEVRRKQEHFRVDPKAPQRGRLLAEQRKAEVERKIARLRLSGRGSVDFGPADVEVADWLDAFCRAVQPNCSEDYHKIIVYTLQKFRDLLADQGAETTGQLRRQHFSDFVSAMQERGNKPKTVNNDLSIIKRAVNWGTEEGWLTDNLLRSFPSVKVLKKRRRALSKDEIEELLSAAAGSDLYEPILFAIYTGARRGELVKLRRSDVDLEAGVIRFRAEITESGEHGDVPIHSRLRPLLEEKAGGTGRLLKRANGRPWTAEAITRRFSALVQNKLGWDDVTFHCLRHTFGSQVAASGQISPFELQRLMRHKSITTSMIYVNMAGQKLPPIDVF